jgi:hypothetical protein
MGDMRNAYKIKRLRAREDLGEEGRMILKVFQGNGVGGYGQDSCGSG